MKSLKYWILVYIYCFIIFIYSATPKPPEPFIVVHATDWIKHIAEYLILSFLVFFAFKNSKSFEDYPALYTIIFVVLFAVSDEIHQLFVPGRYFSVLDILADSFASILFFSLKIINNFKVITYRKI